MGHSEEEQKGPSWFLRWPKATNRSALSRNISKIKQAEEIFKKSFIISDEKPKKNEFIYKIITEKEC